MSSEEESVVNSEQMDYSANYCFLQFIYIYTFLKQRNVVRKNNSVHFYIRKLIYK